MNKTIIPTNEIQYRSIADPFGKVFFWNDRVFRAINEEYKEYCLKLFDSGLLDELFNKGLIPDTWVSDLEMEGFDLILEHKRVKRSLTSNWTFEMLKDVALAYLRINNICNTYGYKLKDGHPWNFLFYKNKPVFVDIGSIVSKEHPDSAFFFEFDEIFINLLLLWSMNETFLARKIVDSNIFKMITIPSQSLKDSKVINSLRDSFLSQLYKKELYKTLSLWQKIKFLKKRKRLKFMHKYFQENCLTPEFIQKYFNTDYVQNTMWSDYQGDVLSSIRNNKFPSNTRFKRITQIINSIDEECSSLIDLAGNQGAFSMCVLKDCPHIENIINTDYDETAINKSYLNLKKHGDNIETFLLNFIHPMGFYQDIKSDIAVALAVTHHLLLTQGYNIEFIFNRIKLFTKKYVVIEFMPKGLWDGKQAPPTPTWYKLEWFRDNFTRHFERIHEEQLEENRIVFIGKIKDSEAQW